jgi:hypothetical protein
MDWGRGTGIQSKQTKKSQKGCGKQFGVTRRTSFNPDDHLKVPPKVLTKILVESSQKDVHLE